MKESPILFSTEMVQAIMADRKLQTRRVVKPQPTKCGSITHFAWGAVTSTNSMPVVSGHATESKCPYGKVGDLLWVRETFGQGVSGKFYYKADKSIADKLVLSWKPSIHMPKAAARIWLRITNIRVERLHEITEEDAIKEGVMKLSDEGFWKYYQSEPYWCHSAKRSFETLWYSINGEESWNVNPWVWVIEFEVISKTGKP